MILSLENKNAVITGASKGLGREIAKDFYSRGANLILIARSIDRLETLVKEIKNPPQTIEIITVDLKNAPEVISLVKNLAQRKIDILVNNAAIQGPIGCVWENNWEEWRDTIQVDLLSPIELSRAVIPSMIKHQYGRIINLSGGGATHARPNFSAYAVAKAGLVRFSETLAEEVKSFNISVNCIAPGVMNTEMLAEILTAGKDKVGEKEFIQATKNLQSDLSVLKNTAALCATLASADNNDITGKLISARWDPWQDLTNFVSDLKDSDIYTLRRITPKDRGKSWGDVE